MKFLELEKETQTNLIATFFGVIVLGMLCFVAIAFKQYNTSGESEKATIKQLQIEIELLNEQGIAKERQDTIINFEKKINV